MKVIKDKRYKCDLCHKPVDYVLGNYPMNMWLCWDCDNEHQNDKEPEEIKETKMVKGLDNIVPRKKVRK